MKIAWKIEVPQWVILAAMFIAGAVAWPSAPSRIPVHWDIHGNANRYGGRFEGLFLLPLVATGIYFLMLLLPRIDPGRANYAKFPGAYSAIRISILGFFALIYAAVLSWVWSGHVDIARLAPLGVGVLSIVLGAVLGKIRPNWFVGVRTPWTLSSKTSWVRTHRLGGWLFMLAGIGTVVASFISPVIAFWVLICGMLGSSVFLVIYSYFVWRNDPDKLPPAGTLPAD